MNLKTTLIIVSLSLFFCLGGAFAADNSDLKKATDRELVLEYELTKSQIKDLSETIKRVQERQQALAAEAQLRPSIVGTQGVKPPSKAKKK